MTKSPDKDILQLFRRALTDAESLVAIANHDSAQVGWRSADSACHHLSILLQCVDKLLFDADIRKHLELCPPSGCTPDGARLPGLKLRNISWHHLTCDLAHDVAITALEWFDADARFLFAEPERGVDDFDYVERPHTDDDKVVHYDVRRFKPGEKRAAQLAKMLEHIRERGHTYWPDMAGALRKTGLNSDHFESTWAGVRREWREFERVEKSAQEASPPREDLDEAKERSVSTAQAERDTIPPTSQTPEGDQWPPDWAFPAGGYSYKGTECLLSGRHRDVLMCLVKAARRGIRLTIEAIIDDVWQGYEPERSNVRGVLSQVNAHLVAKLSLPGDAQPVQQHGRGRHAVWWLDMNGKRKSRDRATPPARKRQAKNKR
ncbi:MAG TPA: hypothetical protein VFE62_24360 [Gemmataceae bacterium]|nr:hypothetical protein [Pirellulales bacterium]HZZ81658.1 hypothetical protein [Gemmataceae bacterium]